MGSASHDLLFSQLSGEVSIALASFAAQHNVSIEQVIVDIVNGSYCVDDSQFYVCFPERVA